MKAIGVDIGGTSVKLAVVDVASASILHRSSFHTNASEIVERPAYELARRTAEYIQPLIEEYGTSLIGIGVPGAMNADRVLVRYPPNLLGWKEEPLKEYLLEFLPRGSIVEVDNDANVATLAEAEHGAGKGTNDFMLVTLGTGVGAGLYLDGKLYRGASGGGGEFGHLSIDQNGVACACGSRGCIEAYIGQRYISREVGRWIDSGQETSLVDATRPIEVRAIAQAAESGDTFSRDYLTLMGSRLGFALSGVAKLLDIHSFIVGGGVAQAGQLILGSAERVLREHVLRNQREHVKILLARYSNDAGMLGAAMLVVTESQQTANHQSRPPNS